MSARENLRAMFAPFLSGATLEEAVGEAYALVPAEAADEMDAHCEKFGVLGVGDRLRRMAAAPDGPLPGGQERALRQRVADQILPIVQRSPINAAIPTSEAPDLIPGIVVGHVVDNICQWVLTGDWRDRRLTDYELDLQARASVPELLAEIGRLREGEPLTVCWDRTVIHPDPAGDEDTIVCCLTDDGRPVALILDDEYREALGLQLVDPDGEGCCGCSDEGEVR
jgi:hypothetical protein